MARGPRSDAPEKGEYASLKRLCPDALPSTSSTPTPPLPIAGMVERAAVMAPAEALKRSFGARGMATVLPRKVMDRGLVVSEAVGTEVAF